LLSLIITLYRCLALKPAKHRGELSSSTTIAMYKLSTIFIAFFTLLAGRVYALNITLNAGGVGTVPADQFLTVNDPDLQGACQTTCQPGENTINACQNDECLCSNQTLIQITACEQCYFAELIKENRPFPGGDIRAGGQAALTAYATACNQSTTTLMALQLPSTWDGPFGQGLSPVTTAITLIVALTVGCGAIGVLITM